MSVHKNLRLLPIALMRLRLHAGHKSQRSAAAAIRKKTGVRVNHPSLSKWERGGEMPSLRSLFLFLEGLDLNFRDLQDELERATGEDVARFERRAAERKEAARKLQEENDRLYGKVEEEPL